MLFHVFIWISENPPKADKSAPTVGLIMLLRHGSNALDTFVLVLRKHCQVGLALFEPCLKVIIGPDGRPDYVVKSQDALLITVLKVGAGIPIPLKGLG